MPFMVIFLYNLNIFVWPQHDCLGNTVDYVGKNVWIIKKKSIDYKEKIGIFSVYSMLFFGLATAQHNFLA